ncbi:MAG: TolC family protein [Myxococcota bacterium]
MGAGLTVCLLVLAWASGAHAADPELSLTAAVRQALDSNLDLLSRRRALAASREEIGVARSALLPQVGVGARAQVLDAKRADSARGNNLQESVLLAAGLQQVLYDEPAWAGYQIQQHVYDGQVQELESFQLGVVQDAAGAFLALDQSQVELDIQERNRELTRRNRETSRARIAAGWSSEREVLRWDIQLAANDSSVRAAQVGVLQGRFELNRVRNRPPETVSDPARTTLEDYGFLYAREAIAAAIVAPEEDQAMRNFLVRVGLRRAPELAALDAGIAAAERQLVASQRAFWVPSLNLAAGVDYLANNKGGNEFNVTEWGVKGVFTFPLVLGGAKFANLGKSQEDLASLRTARGALTITLEQTIRSALAQASGAYESIGFAQRETAAAQKNYELVDASYTLGVASILDLRDAQNQLLDAELKLTDVSYGFFADLIAAERAIAYFSFLEDPTEVAAILDQLEQALGVQP